jgi:cytochrome c-type biogenesis protein CcmH
MLPDRPLSARWRRFPVLCLLLLYALPVGALLQAQDRVITKEQVQEVTSNLVCLCGCGNKTVSLCGCGVADATSKEVEGMLRQGQTPEQVLAHYVDAGGLVALAAPPKQGFNLLAWVLPFVGVLAAGAFLVVKIRHWNTDSVRQAAVLSKPHPTVPEDSYQDRLSRELEKLN